MKRTSSIDLMTLGTPNNPGHTSRAFGFITTHLFGAARMGIEAKTGVVGTDFQSHEVAGLYVVDSSVFPTNLGVNPQHSIMAMSRLAATRLAEKRTGRSTPPANAAA
jgi:choline dehydrogenase-like flavoprotein